MKYLSADLLPKVFHGLICITDLPILIIIIDNQKNMYFFRQKLQYINYLTLN